MFSVMEPVSDAMMGELSRRRGWTRETLDELGVRAFALAARQSAEAFRTGCSSRPVRGRVASGASRPYLTAGARQI
ncbi:MAG: hypothetical protein ACLR7Z_10605 [Bilophila wadsworthia]